jgi:hypothetical protein
VNQTAELSRVKARINALTEKTVANGLERYALSMGRDRDPDCPLRSGDGAAWQAPATTDRWLRASDRPLLRLQGLARSCRCAGSDATGGHPGRARPPLGIFGFETDTALATYMFAVIDRAVSTERTTFRQLNPRLQGVRLAAGLSELPTPRSGSGIRPPGRHTPRPRRDCARTTLDQHRFGRGQQPCGRRGVRRD